MVRDITKLPKWAQELIIDLEERVKYWQEEAYNEYHDSYDLEEMREQEYRYQAGESL